MEFAKQLMGKLEQIINIWKITIIQLELFNLHKDLPFLPRNKKSNKVEKLICSIGSKEKYVI